MQQRMPGQHATSDQRIIQRLQPDKYHIPNDAFVLIYAAEFSKRKSQMFLIKAMRLLPGNIVLVLPGEGALLDKCKKLAARIGLWSEETHSNRELSDQETGLPQVEKGAVDKHFHENNRVIFPGQVQDMASWYRAADAAVTASRSEGLPFNVMEAMYMGLPVVATAVKGHTDLIRDGENGLLYPYGDEEAFTQCLQKIMTDDGLRIRIGKQAHASSSQYALDRVLPEVMGWYLRTGHDPKRTELT